MEVGFQAMDFISTTLKIYKFKGPIRILNALLTLIFLPSIFLYTIDDFGHSIYYASCNFVFALFYLTFTVNFLKGVVAGYVRVDGDTISVRNIFISRSIRKDEILGKRMAPRAFAEPSIHLIAKHTGGKDLLILSGYEFDDEWQEWIENLPDLDKQDKRERSLASAGTDDLSIERRRYVAVIALILSIGTGLAACAIRFDYSHLSQSYLQILSTIVLLMPFIALAIHFTWPKLFSLFKDGKDPRTVLGAIVYMPIFALPIGAFQTNRIEDRYSLLWFAILPVIILGFLVFRALPRKTRSLFFVLGTMTVVFSYAYGICEVIDTAFDSSTTKEYSTTENMSNKRMNFSFANLIWVHPFGTVQETQEVRIDKSVYGNLHDVDSVCITEHQGTLHVPWYTVHLCQ